MMLVGALAAVAIVAAGCGGGGDDSSGESAQVTGDTEHCGTIKESDTDAETVATVNGDVQCINLSKVDGEWKIFDI